MDVSVESDPYYLATLKDYFSLMPMFALKFADGARGSHLTAVQKCRTDFQQMAQKITDAVAND